MIMESDLPGLISICMLGFKPKIIMDNKIYMVVDSDLHVGLQTNHFYWDLNPRLLPFLCPVCLLNGFSCRYEFYPNPFIFIFNSNHKKCV